MIGKELPLGQNGGCKDDIYISLQDLVLHLSHIQIMPPILHVCVEMLSHQFSAVDEEQFRKLPTSTNAVEFHSQLSKAEKPEILKVAMLTTYNVDMAMALEHMARSEGMSTSYK